MKPDMKVIVSGREFEAHSFLLYQVQYFEAIMDRWTAEGDNVITLSEESASHFQILLKFLYEGNLQLDSDDDAISLIMLADRLGYNLMKEKIEYALIDILDLENCIVLHRLSLDIHCSHLRDISTGFILQMFNELKSSQSFVESGFYQYFSELNKNLYKGENK
eukprot:TRINITY_DN2304_c0_g1_i1.p1 TRINITY_DN2304_c0_g1~~TRINITY_DN2304_c0_g1_i1.p1  ORF type:complete len:163 (-),score=35.38 TRINITY_DN2304_c0_g1_i1:11-499(-)